MKLYILWFTTTTIELFFSTNNKIANGESKFENKIMETKRIYRFREITHNKHQTHYANLTFGNTIIFKFLLFKLINTVNEKRSQYPQAEKTIEKLKKTQTKLSNGYSILSLSNFVFDFLSFNWFYIFYTFHSIFVFFSANVSQNEMLQINKIKTK